MEKKINKRISEYLSEFKDNIREKTTQLGLTKNENINPLIQYIYDYLAYLLNNYICFILFNIF